MVSMREAVSPSARSQDVKASYYIEKKKDDQYAGLPKMTGLPLKSSQTSKQLQGSSSPRWHRVYQSSPGMSAQLTTSNSRETD